MEKDFKDEMQENPLLFKLPTKGKLDNVVRAHPMGGSYVVVIPKAWLEIFLCDDEEGNFWVEREIDGNTIIIKPHRRS